MDLIENEYDDRYYCILHFSTNLIYLNLDSRSQESKKAKTAAPINSQSFQSFRMEFSNTVEACWCSEAHIHFILSIQYSMERTLLQ